MVQISQIAPGALRFDKGLALLKSADYERVQKGARILKTARETARRMKEEAKRSCEKAKRRARREGLEEARRETIERHFAFVERACLYMRDVEQEMGAMIVESLRKILGELDSDLLTEKIVLKALRQYRNLPSLTLRVPPKEEERLRRKLDKLSREASLAVSLRLEADGRLARGDCALESPLGVVEIGMETQIQALREAMEARDGASFLLPRPPAAPPADKDS